MPISRIPVAAQSRAFELDTVFRILSHLWCSSGVPDADLTEAVTPVGIQPCMTKHVSIDLSPTEVRTLRKPIRGHGGFQSLLRKLQHQRRADILTSPASTWSVSDGIRPRTLEAAFSGAPKARFRRSRQRRERSGSGKRRARSRSTPARPYIWRRHIFSRLIWPSTGPLLQRSAEPGSQRGRRFATGTG
jgi:hypothetical protein